MADEEGQVLAAAKKLPWPDRIAHKQWKVRSDAYSDIKQTCERAFSAEDPCFSEFAPLFVKALGDTNAAALDKALEALVAYLDKVGQPLVERLASPVCHAIVSKDLKQRPATVKKCSDVFFALVELEQAEAVTEALIKGFADKVPKVVVAVIDVLWQIFSAFGHKVMAPQPILKALPTLFEAKQEPVRDGAKKLVLELAGYLGPQTVQATLLEKMPETMRKDVEKLLGEAGAARSQPTRFTRREQARRAAGQGAASASMGDAAATSGAACPAAAHHDAAPDDDPYEYAEPANILDQLNKEFWEGLGSAKWTERRDSLQHLKGLASSPKLAPGDFGDVLRELRKVIVKDSNVVCVAEAVGCIGALAKGLRSNFSSQGRAYVPILLDKLKEKNMNCCANCSDALNHIVRHCATLPDIAEDVVPALDHKNPKVKLETCKLLQGWVNMGSKALLTKAHPILLPAVHKISNDPAPDIREAALGVLAALIIKQGTAAFQEKVCDKLDEPRKKKLGDLVAAARSGGTGASALAPVSSQPAATARGPQKPARMDQALSPKNTNSARPAAAKAPPAAKRADPKAASQPADDDDSALQGGTLSKAEAEEKLAEVMGASLVEGLRSANWKDRLGSMENLVSKVQDILEAKENGSTPISILIQALSYLPGWAEKNFQVTGKVFEAITLLASADGTFLKKDAFIAITGFVDKIADSKLKPSVCTGLTALAEAVGPQFVFTQVHKKALVHKSPKVLSESLLWMGKALEEFGLATLDVKALIDWLKADLTSTNAAVRTAAVSVLGTCHQQLGPGLAAMIRPDVKPALMATVDEAFAANPQQQVVPTRKVRGAHPKAAAGSGAASKSASAGASVESEHHELDPDDLLPRTDISGQITPRLIGLLSSANWKERNAGLEEVDDILRNAGGRVQPNIGDLIPALRARLNDSNANLIARTLTLLGDLAKAMGPAFDRTGRPCLAPVLLALSDKKKQVRDGVISMLDGYLLIAPPDRLLPAVADYLAGPKCVREGKLMGLQWFAAAASNGKASKCLDAAVKAGSAGVHDKNGDVREAGVQLMLALLQFLSEFCKAGIQLMLAPLESHGQGELAQACSHLDSSSRSSALEAIEKVSATKEGTALAIKAPASARNPPARERPGTSTSARAPGNKPTKPALGSRPTEGGTSVPEAIQAAAPSSGNALALAVSDKKEDRARKGRFKPSKFEPPREDEEDNLQQEFGPLTSPALRTLLFSKDFKKTVEAVDALLEAARTTPDAANSCMDILLRWAVVRLCDPHGNTTAILKVLELCKGLFSLLESQGAQLSQYEATCILPTLVEKSGHNQDRIRLLHRDLLRQARGIYQPTRVLEFFCAGLSSKNSRTRVECAELLSEVVVAEGMTSLSKSREKPFAAIALMVTERDKAMRAAALAAVEALYLAEGPAVVWAQLGKLTDQQRSLIEERLKYTEKAAGPTAGPTGQTHREEEPRPQTAGGLSRNSSQSSLSAHPPRPATSSSSHSQVQHVTPMRAPALSVPSHPLIPDETPAPVRPSFRAPIPTPVPASTPHDREGDISPIGNGAGRSADARSEDILADSWAQAMLLLHTDDLEQSVEGMKLICYELMDAANRRPSDQTLRLYDASANELVIELTWKVEQVFDKACAENEAGRMQEGTGSPRSCKYVLNTLLQAFQLDHMARSVSARPLKDLIAVLLVRLLDERVPLLPDGAQLLKALNVLMLKMLDHSKRTFSFQALLQLLRCPPAVVTEKHADTAARFADLVVKCLIKLTKTLQTTIQEVDLEELMLSIHDFFMGLGVDEIRRRGALDDKPLRMVKTLLHELCKVKGTRIRDYMGGIPSDCEPVPIIHAYVDLNLQTLESAGLIVGRTSSTGSKVQIAAYPPTSAGVSATISSYPLGKVPLALAEGAVDDQAAAKASLDPKESKNRLASIFKLIGEKATTSEGIEALYQYQQAHPEVDLAPHLAKTSAQFRQYIERGLQRVSARAQLASGALSGQLSARTNTSAESPNFKMLRARMEQVKLNMNAASHMAHKPGREQGPDPPVLSNVEVLQERMRSLRLARGL